MKRKGKKPSCFEELLSFDDSHRMYHCHVVKAAAAVFLLLKLFKD